MPIGKNSLKRVTNNGYSSVKTTAPDMENSTIVGVANPEATAAEKKPTATKAAPKTAAKKATATKTDAITATKPATKKAAPKAAKPEATATEKKAAAKKTTAAKTAEKKPTTAKTAPKTATKKPTTAKTAPKVTATTIPAPAEVVMTVVAPNTPENGKPYCNLGDKLPTHLL